MAALLTTPARGSQAAPADSQLESLRQALAGRPAADRTRRGTGDGPTVLVCASGRGGSGTTLASAALALAAAGDGHRTLLVDGDELTGPLALLLGVSPAARWPALLGAAVPATALATDMAPTLSLVAGGRGDAAAPAAPLSVAERRACFARIHSLAESYALVVIDAGARLDAVLAALEGQPHRTAPRDHRRRPRPDRDGIVVRPAQGRATRASRTSPSTCSPTASTTPRAARVADTLALGAQQFLARPLAFAGALPHDPALDAALRAGMPFLDAVTGSPVAVAAHDTVLRMVPSASTTRSGD